MIYQNILSDHLDPDVLLSDIIDDETYELYEEIDRILSNHDAQQSHTIMGRLEIAKSFAFPAVQNV